MKSFVILVIFSLAEISYASPKPILKPVMDSIEGSGRIAHGSDAQPGQFPYQVALSPSTVSSNIAWCSGSVISNTFVMTAASCVDGMSSIIVELGSRNRSAPELIRTVQQENIFPHPNWDPSTKRNDIALLKIERIEFSNTINKVAIPAITAANYNYIGLSGIATGWGRVSIENSEYPQILKYGFMDITNNLVCYLLYGSAITSDSLCVATYRGSSVCDGDFGGPLVLPLVKVQVGVASFGPPNRCGSLRPAVFTGVASYVQWIRGVSGVFY